MAVGKCFATFLTASLIYIPIIKLFLFFLSSFNFWNIDERCYEERSKTFLHRYSEWQVQGKGKFSIIYFQVFNDYMINILKYKFQAYNFVKLSQSCIKPEGMEWTSRDQVKAI